MYNAIDPGFNFNIVKSDWLHDVISLIQQNKFGFKQLKTSIKIGQGYKELT